jgi:hypothetical protein
MSPTQQLIERMLGVWGRAVLGFYEAHALWINTPIVLYGIVLWFSWRNLQGIRGHFVEALVAQMRRMKGLNKKTDPASLLDSLSIPWESGPGESVFPLVARQWGFLPRRPSEDAIRKMLDPGEMAAEALEIVTGAKRGTLTRRYRMMKHSPPDRRE